MGIVYFLPNESLKKYRIYWEEKLSKQKISRANERREGRDKFPKTYSQINDFNWGETNKFPFNVDCGFALMLHFCLVCTIFFY
jgi:hypothetical protein